MEAGFPKVTHRKLPGFPKGPGVRTRCRWGFLGTQDPDGILKIIYKHKTHNKGIASKHEVLQHAHETMPELKCDTCPAHPRQTKPIVTRLTKHDEQHV